MSATTFTNESMAVPGTPAGKFNPPKHRGLMVFLIVLLAGFLAVFVANFGQLGDSFRDAFDEQFPNTFSVASDPSSSDDPASDEAPAEKAPEALTPRMRAVLDYVTRRYHVAATTLAPILEAAQITGRDRGIDPLLIVAVIGIESGFNPYAESSFGAQGLMQIIPRFHLDKVPEGAGRQPFLDPVTNVQIGGHVLQEAIRQRGGLIPGLQQYAGASDPESTAYASKVLAEKQRLEQAAGRARRPAA